MALDAMEYPPDLFGYAYKELHTLSALWGGYEQDKTLIGILDNSSSASSHAMQNGKEYWDPDSSPEAGEGSTPAEAQGGGGRRKRRRTKSSKNKEELESQRMTHIAVERNRRKQMNEYLAIVRSLMPASYVQRGDQASIIGGAVNFVKELEQLLQVLEAQKRTMNQQPNNALSPIFSDFFTFPQYSTTSPVAAAGEASAEHQPAMAEIEVTMAESHATLKILSKRRPRQLLKLVAGIQCLMLTVLHLNVTTVDQMVLYSLSVKIEDGSQLSTVDEIADAVNHLLARIEEEAVMC
ncbi:Transcription factor bHLH96 like [Actinidia chinensis var. chinensis]|uniref:Transcription factor bHLH96 like n=1 Tax=Actinidia chinensis var. chinensis TaxID=1590841 RepID=A0A2R6RNJ6_ACTCC|nr:Transcription factor bHLH96 like [Actinidia chinensis var. chinensis]